jgi:hypothetical protein
MSDECGQCGLLGGPLEFIFSWWTSGETAVSHTVLLKAYAKRRTPNIQSWRRAFQAKMI